MEWLTRRGFYNRIVKAKVCPEGDLLQRRVPLANRPFVQARSPCVNPSNWTKKAYHYTARLCRADSV